MKVELTASKRTEILKDIEKAKKIIIKELSYGDLRDNKMISDYEKYISDMNIVLANGFVDLGVVKL
jgi:hypothetical protein